jgi:asparagine synthase (glutamine-hydrolysing)
MTYQNQGKLLPGQFLQWRHGAPTLAFYWQPQFQDQATVSEHALSAEYRTLLRDAVKRCSADDVTGAFLSGGIDSSTVVGLLAEGGSERARAYSIGFDASGYDEMSYARIAAKHFGAVHREYYVTPQDVVDVIPRIASEYDEPFGNSSAVAVYYCARAAQQDGVRVMLAGDGGDELLGGNTRYAKQKIFEAYRCLPPGLRAKAIEPLMDRFPGIDVFPPLRKLKSYVDQARVPMPDRLETYNYLHREPPTSMLHPDFLAVVRTDAPLELLRTTYERAPSRALVNRMLYLDWKHTLADNDLRKVNRMCQLAGIEARYPLLDDALVEFSTRVPPQWKVRRTQLRFFVKRALADFLPRPVITKSKHGFGLPFGVWMQSYDPLRELVYDSLANLKKRALLRPDYIDRLLRLHREEHAAYYGEFIWILVMLELWLHSH